jgi:hypothetical protein
MERCQLYNPDVLEATFPDTRFALPLRKKWWQLKKLAWFISLQGPSGFVIKNFNNNRLSRFASRPTKNKKNRFQSCQINKILNLQPGDWVEVCSAKEIFSELDTKGKSKGLSFTREMQKHCGRRYKVWKRLDKFVLESNGKMRKIKTPTFLLEGVICDGEFHAGCAKSCFHFWRESWLQKIDVSSKESEI